MSEAQAIDPTVDQKTGRTLKKLRKAARPTSITHEVGATGLSTSGGRITEEWHPDISTLERRMQLFKEMEDNSAIVGGIQASERALVRGVPWEVQENEATSGTPEAAKWAAFVETVMADMASTWADTMVRQMTISLYQFSLSEVTYKRRLGDSPPPRFDENGDLKTRPPSKHNDRLWGIHKIAVRAQTSIIRWEWSKDRGYEGVHQRARWPDGTSAEVFLPSGKTLLVRLDSALDNPEGGGGGRAAVRSYKGLQFAEDMELVGIERHMAGLPTMEVPPDILADDDDGGDEEAVTQWREAMAEVKMDDRAGIVVPAETDADGVTGYKFSLKASEGTPIDVNPTINRKNTEIAIVWAAENIMVGVSGVGSFSLHSDKTTARAQAIHGRLMIIADAVNRQVIEPLLRLNGVPQAFWPTVVPGDLEKMDLQVWGASVAGLISAGAIIPDEKVERRARTLFHIEQPDATELGDVRPVPMPDEPDPMEPPDDEADAATTTANDGRLPA